MKLVIVLLTITLLQANASGYAQLINVTGKNKPLTEVFKDIRKQSGYDFIYNLKSLKNANNITVDLHNVSINEALEQCLKN